MPEFADPQKPCSGCAHSASSAPYPGHPSGERPCMFCERNPEGVMWDEGVWYDGSPAFKTPMDCYISLDRLTQSRVNDALEKIARGEQEVKPRGDGKNFAREAGLSEEELQATDVTCCEGGTVNGHDFTCMYVIGIGFG